MILWVWKFGFGKGPLICLMTAKSTGNTTCDDEIYRKQAYGKRDVLQAPGGKT